MTTKFIDLALITLAIFFAAGCTTPEKPSFNESASSKRGFQPDCVFCEIASGATRQERVVYRDTTVVAFMDRAPRNPGHVLVIPRHHATGLLDVPESTLGHMAEVAQRIAQAIKSTDLRADGFNVISNTGASAGQTVFHLHLHVIPRFQGEPPAQGEHHGIRPNDELNAVAAKLRAKLQ